MKQNILALAIVIAALAACEHRSLSVGKTDAKPVTTATEAPASTSSATAIDTAPATSVRTDTATGTATQTATKVDASIDDSTKTKTATATVKTPLIGKLTVNFTTAFHASAMFPVKIGQKSVPIGTFEFINGTNKRLEVREFIANFIFSNDPYSELPWSDAVATVGGAELVSSHLANCTLKSWPEIKAYSAPLGPGKDGAFRSIDRFEIEPFTGTNALGLDLVCDIVGPEIYSELGIGVEVMDSENIAAYDQDGNRASVTREQLNGSPPKAAAILQPPSCKAEKPATIGTGVDPAISGSTNGFGIVWKDMSHMPKEMNPIWFRSIDIGGNAWGKDEDVLRFGDDRNSMAIDVSGTASGFLVSASSNQLTSYSAYDAKGVRQVSALNQRLGYLIDGSNNNAFTFFDSGEGFPALHELQIAGSVFADVAKEQWGPSGGSVVTKGVTANGTWAFGLMNNGQPQIVVVRPEGVYPQTVKMGTSKGTVTMGSLIATDDSYVLSWSQDGKRYLSFARTDGMSDGFVRSTVESVWLVDRMYQIDRLAWDGKHIALLTTSVSNGQSDLILFDKNGKDMGHLLNLVAAGQGKWLNGRSGFAGNKGTFGAVTSDDVDQTVKFYQIHCE